MKNTQTREGLEWWDKLNKLPRFLFQLLKNEERYLVKKVETSIGLHIEKFAAEELVSEMQDVINELTQENSVLKKNIHLTKIVPKGDRCERCPKSDPYSTSFSGPILTGYRGPYFCHLLERVIENGDKECGINESPDEPYPKLTEIVTWAT